MRYTAEHKAEARKKIVSSAAELAKKEGFGTTGVDDLMRSAGMTGGAFYKHFSTKEDLLSEIVAAEVQRSIALFGAREDATHTTTKTTTHAAEHALEKYLSLAHVTTPEKGCLLPALSAEIGRASDEVKQGFEAEIKRLVSELAPTMGNTTKAWAVLSLCVGGVLLARALKTEETQQALLKACNEGTHAILK